MAIWEVVDPAHVERFHDPDYLRVGFEWRLLHELDRF
jgi:hypothetical protein